MNKLCAIQNIPHNTTTMILCVSDAHTHTHTDTGRDTRTWNVTLFTIYFDIQNCTSFKRDDEDDDVPSRGN